MLQNVNTILVEESVLVHSYIRITGKQLHVHYRILYLLCCILLGTIAVVTAGIYCGLLYAVHIIIYSLCRYGANQKQQWL